MKLRQFLKKNISCNFGNTGHHGASVKTPRDFVDIFNPFTLKNLESQIVNLSTISFYFILFIFSEGNLKVQHVNKKIWSDRYVFLLDGMILVCKKQRKRQTLTGNAANNSEYSFREKFLIRKVDVIDAKEDEPESELCFRIGKKHAL